MVWVAKATWFLGVLRSVNRHPLFINKKASLAGGSFNAKIPSRLSINLKILPSSVPLFVRTYKGFIPLGLSQRLKVLVVCHCYRTVESKIRIISARKATKKEQGVYLRR